MNASNSVLTFRSFAVIPAAGQSVRMGRAKLTLPWGATTLIQHVVAQWLATAVSRIAVIVRADDVEIRSILSSCPVDVIVAEEGPPDMKSSVQIGLRELSRHQCPQPTDVWLMAPADIPTLSSAVIDALLAAYDPTDPVIWAPIAGTQRIHPTLFPWSLSEEVDRLPADEGIRGLLARHQVRTLPVPAEPEFDVDTPADWDHWCELVGARRNARRAPP